MRKGLRIPRHRVIGGRRVLYGKAYRSNYDILLACNDVLKFLKSVPNQTATLIVTSPPYNVGKAYEERVEFRGYLDWQEQVVEECIRVLRPNGSIFWEVGNYVEDKEVFPLDLFFYDMFKTLGLRLRNRIVWRYRHGLHARVRFSGRYEVILWFTKGDDYIFNLDSVRVPQKYPGKRAYKGSNNGRPTGNPLGMNPSDMWDVVLRDWEEEVWDIPNVKSNHPEKTVHPSQFPIELVERAVLALTNKGNIVLDPFAGVGSSLVAATLHNRRAMGVDKVKRYTDIAYQRLIKAIDGNLRRRPFGKPIHEPRGTERVARIPPEWEEVHVSR